MPKVSIKRTVNGTLEEVWNAWDDFAAIDKFNPNLNKSFLINESKATGLGAERQCDLSDGKNYIRERVIEYVPHQKIKVDIFDGTMPLKRALALIQMRKVGPNVTEVEFEMEFEPKMGLLGKLMVPLMKPQFRKLLGKLLDGNKAFVEHGTIITRAA